MTTLPPSQPAARADLIKRLRNECIDWDKTPLPDGAEPMPTTTVGLLREAADALAALEAPAVTAGEVGGLVLPNLPEPRSRAPDGTFFYTPTQMHEFARAHAASQAVEIERLTADLDAANETIGACIVNMPSGYRMKEPLPDAIMRLRGRYSAALGHIADLIRLYEGKWSDEPHELVAARTLLAQEKGERT